FISSHEAGRTIHRIGARHFLLEALEGWWAKFLPSSYGVLIRLEGAGAKTARELFFIVRSGKFEEFGCPDYTGIGRDRARSEAETVKYLSEKHSVPFQGVFLPEKDWEEWSLLSDPWKLVHLAARNKKLRMVPSRLGVRSL